MLFSDSQKSKFRTGITTLVLALLTLLPVGALAQSLGSLKVEVNQANKLQILSRVNLVLTSRSGLILQGQTNDQGEYRFENLGQGLYELSANLPGFTGIVEPSVRIVNGKQAALTLRMQKRPSTLEEVLVLANATGNSEGTSLGAAYKDREALRSATGSGSDVLRALDGLPGLVSVGAFASFTVRGRGPKDNLILVDDIPFDRVVHFNGSLGSTEEVDGGGRYSVFAPNLIAGADYQPGGWGAAYAGRSGSLLNLNVAEGNAESPSFSVRLDFAGLELTYDGPSYFQDDTSLLFSARQLDFGQFFETIGIDDIGSPKMTDIIFKSHTELEDNEFDFLLIYAPEEYVRDIDNVLAGDDDGEIFNYALENTDMDNSLYAFTWRRYVGTTSQISQRFYYKYFDKLSSSGEAFPDLAVSGSSPQEIPVRENILSLKEEETELGYRLDYTNDNTRGEFAAGLRLAEVDVYANRVLADDWIRFEYNARDYRADPSQLYILLEPRVINTLYERNEAMYALYIQQSWEIGDWQWLTGARYDYDGFTDENLLSPRTSLRWMFSSSLRFAATAGIFYQAPLMLDRTRSNDNSILENEEVSQISFGFEKTYGLDWSFLSDIYYQDLNNIVTSPDAVTGVLTNNGEGYSYGADFVLSRRFSKAWSGNINYSYNQSDIDNNDGLGKLPSDYQRPHAFAISGLWEINERWKMSARWKVFSGRPADEYIIHSDVLGAGEPLRFSREVTAEKTTRFARYQNLNFRVDYRRYLGAADLVAFLDIVNLLGSKNPDESVFSDRTGRFQPQEGEIFPLFGLRFEF